MVITKSVRALRAANAGVLPGGKGRMSAFPSELRAKMVEKDGKNFFEVEGYATVYNRGYPMWDEFGPYNEVADAHMLDRSLALSPDVAFLLNHKGMTMARTRNGSLTLANDDHGLRTKALLNADRSDVQDMVRAINDGLLDEMSFAFMIDEGAWSEDFSEFRLMQVDINRGDVSAVNYGANPYTSIGSRAAQFMRELPNMPASVQRAATAELLKGNDPYMLRSAAAVLDRQARERYDQGSRELAKIAGITDLSNWDAEEADETRAMPADPTTDPIESAEAEPCDPHAGDGEVPDGTSEDPTYDDGTDAPIPAPEPHSNSVATAHLRAWTLTNDEIPAAESQPVGTTEETRSGTPVDLYARRWRVVADTTLDD